MEKITGRLSEKVSWVKELVLAEEQMEESGLVEMGSNVCYNQEKFLTQETYSFLQILKDEFIQASQLFNELKASPLGRIKIYGIAKTQCDFMLFRNGFKMIFSFKIPGTISIRFNFFSPNSYMYQNQSEESFGQPNQSPSLMEEQLLIAQSGPLNEIKWCYSDQPVSVENIVKYHLTLFVKESAK